MSTEKRKEEEANTEALQAPVNKEEQSPPATEDSAETAGEKSTRSAVPAFIERMVVDLQDGIDEVWQALQPRTAELLRKGKHTQVRLSFRGREFARLSLLAFLAAEAVAILRISLPAMLMFNVAGKIFLTVDFVDEVSEWGEKGKKHLDSGDLEEALSCFDTALDLDSHRAEIHLLRAKALQQKGDQSAAREALAKAVELDAEGKIGEEGRALLSSLEG